MVLEWETIWRRDPSEEGSRRGKLRDHRDHVSTVPWKLIENGKWDTAINSQIPPSVTSSSKALHSQSYTISPNSTPTVDQIVKYQSLHGTFFIQIITSLQGFYYFQYSRTSLLFSLLAEIYTSQVLYFQI